MNSQPQTTDPSSRPRQNSLRFSRLIGLLLLVSLMVFAVSLPTSHAQTRSASEAPPAGLDEALRGDTQLRPRGSGPGSSSDLRPHDLKDALEVIRDYRPDLFERFEGWAARNPEEARQLLSRNVPMLNKLIRQRREDAEGYKLTIQDMRLFRLTSEVSRELRTTDPKENASRAQELSNRLRDLLVRHFEVRQQIREREIAKLEQRVEQLRKQMSVRNQSRDKIIQERLDQLTADIDRPSW